MDRQDLIPQFLLDSQDILDNIENILLNLEKEKKSNKPISSDTIHTLFRHFHTLKGSSGLFNLSTVVSITHEAETLLDIIRSSDNNLIVNCIDILLSTIDVLRGLFNYIEIYKTNPPTNDDINLIKQNLHKLIQQIQEKSISDKKQSEKFGLFEDEIEEDRTIKNESYGLFEDNLTQDPSISDSQDKIDNLSFSYDNVKEFSFITKNIESETNPLFHKKQQDSKNKEIKISTEKIDLLLELVGELVIAESNVSSHPEIENLKLDGFRQATRQLNKIVRELQEVALSTRMIPISGLFHRMKRLVRDLEKNTNKKLQLIISGEDTEIDKSIIDLLQDPIIHIIRNAVDHGIETPLERIESGKEEHGIIHLHAFQSVNEVWIVIIDDGKGLNKNKIIKRAYELGLINSLDTLLTDKDIYEFIFYPGFSTAEQVSDISGRGVGMDIVKKNIENLGGKIELLSEEGIGTRVTLRIPLSLGIMEGTVFRVSDSFFTVQTTDIRELIQLNSSQIFEIYSGKKVIHIRGTYIPVFNINDIISLRKILNYDSLNNLVLIVLEKDSKSLGILTDSIIGNQSIVIKPFPKILKNAKGVTGFTILGNGKISLILDVKYLFDKFLKEFNDKDMVKI